jgi:hypothetical protein
VGGPDTSVVPPGTYVSARPSYTEVHWRREITPRSLAGSRSRVTLAGMYGELVVR